MLKRKIKIILIGLSSVVILGLIYSLFSTKAEIISDESLRIEEPVIPGLESQLERAEKANMSRPSLKGDAEIGLSFEGNPVDHPPLETVRDLSENSVNEPVAKESAVLRGDLAQSVNPFADNAPQLAAKDSDAVPSQDEFITFDAVANDVVADSDTAEFKDIDALELVEEQKNDSVITSDATGFLDLNQATPVKLEIVLTEKDQLILDEINQSISKYKSHDSKTEAVANDEDKALELNLEELAKSEEAKRSEEVTASDESPKRPSVFAMPDVDESLMQGDNEISQQYRVTMSNLISINAKLRAAEEENTELRTQFDISVSQNRQMAQIIRDIDNQIKAFTLTN